MIASTPSAYTGLTVPLPLPAGSEACADEILFDANAGIARFGATAPAGTPAPALEVTARRLQRRRATAATTASSARVPGGWTGHAQLDVPLTPPRTRRRSATLCVRNLGDRPIDLVGSQDGRAYSRPTVTRRRQADADRAPAAAAWSPVATACSSRVGRDHGARGDAEAVRRLVVVGARAGAADARAARRLARRSGPRSTADDARAGRRSPGPAIAAGLERRARAGSRRSPAGRSSLAVARARGACGCCYWSLSTHVFQNDEDQYVYLSRWLQTDFPASLFDFDALRARPAAARGVAAGDSGGAVRLARGRCSGGRILNTLAFVSTAIPVYLLGRSQRLRPQWAALPAALSIVVPVGAS